MYLAADWAGIKARLAAQRAPSPLASRIASVFKPATTAPAPSRLWPTIDRIRSTSVFSPSAPINIRTVPPPAHYAPAPPSSVPSMQTITLAPLPQGGGDTLVAPEDVAVPTQAGIGDLFKSPVALGLLGLAAFLTLRGRK